MSGINLSLVANVREFLKGTRDASNALDDVVGSLDEVARESDTTRRETIRDQEQIGAEAKDASDKLEKSFRSAFDAARRESQDASRDVQRNTKKGFTDAGNASGEFKDEAKQNFSEVASSFSGDMGGAVDLVQGTLGGLAASIPGIGLALGGLAAAAGVFYQQWSDKAEATKQRISDMYQDMIASGDAFLSEQYKQQQYWSVITNDDGAVLSLKKATEYADLLGTSVSNIALAWTGNDDEMTTVLDKINGKITEFQKKSAETSGEQSIQYAEQVSWLERVKVAAEARRDEIDTTATSFAEAHDAWNAYGTEVSKTLKKQHEEQGKVIDSLGTIRDAVNQIPNKTVQIGIDSRSFDSGLRELARNRRTVQIQAEFVTRDGKKVI